MLSERFEHLFRRLIGAFIRYDGVPRTSATVVTLATARTELDALRTQIAVERDSVLGPGRSQRREDHWRAEEAIARDNLFTLANISN